MAMKDQHHEHLIPGFFFRPSDEHLVNHLLRRRIVDGSPSVPDCLIKEFDVYSTEPWNLPCNSFQHLSYEKEMHFFTPRRPTSHKSKRADRTSGTGFWDGNAKGTPIIIDSNVVGHKTSLNFKIIQGGDKIKTEWIMHEYRLSRSSSTTTFDDLVLCRIHENKKNKNDDGHKRSWGQEEEIEQNLSKKRHVEEEDPALLPSSSSSVSWHMMPAVHESVDGCEAPSAPPPSNDQIFLEEAPLAADEGLNLEKAPLIVDDGLAHERWSLANIEWDETLILLENFSSDPTSQAFLCL